MAQFQASTKAADAPEIVAQMYDLIFAGVSSKKVKGGQYTKNKVDGDPKLEWAFKLLDDDGNVIREDREDNDNFGKPIIVSKLTGVNFNIAAKTEPGEVKMLKALLTPAEFAAFENGEGTPDSDTDADEGGLLGRKAQGEVFINDNGWPQLGTIVAARKPVKGKS